MFNFILKNVSILTIMMVVYLGAVYTEDLSVVSANGTTSEVNNATVISHNDTSTTTTMESGINATNMASSINATTEITVVNTTTMASAINISTTISPATLIPSTTKMSTTITSIATSVTVPIAMILPMSLGNCSCGGFASENVTIDQQPILQYRPEFVVKCNDDGYTVCKNLCVAVATATKAKGPKILCSRVGTADELKMVVLYKICTDTWMYSGERSQDPLCCENSAVKQCASTSNKSDVAKVNKDKEILQVWH